MQTELKKGSPIVEVARNIRFVYGNEGKSPDMLPIVLLVCIGKYFPRRFLWIWMILSILNLIKP